MLFSTSGGGVATGCSNRAMMSPRKLKLPAVIRMRNDLLSNSKFVHNQSSPSIGGGGSGHNNPHHVANLSYLKKCAANGSNSFLGINNNNNNSLNHNGHNLTSSRLVNQHCNLHELRKFSSTTALVQTTTETIMTTTAAAATTEQHGAAKSATIDEIEITSRKSTTTLNMAGVVVDDDDFENFKSVKDKIAYFSSKAAAKRAASKKLPNMLNKAKSNSVLLNDTNATSNSKLAPSSLSAGGAVGSQQQQQQQQIADSRLPFANKIEIVSSNSATLSKQSSKLNCQSEDYDSLKHAYKLNALANSTSKKKLNIKAHLIDDIV